MNALLDWLVFFLCLANIAVCVMFAWDILPWLLVPTAMAAVYVLGCLAVAVIQAWWYRRQLAADQK